ncbi:MAG: TonB-dependent receptor [Bacteroidales bacterium]|nr:TonB-dependent receptor [Bacteroidales bacterium]
MNIQQYLRSAFVAAMIAGGQYAFAEIVTGTVLDNEGEPVIGGSVRLKDGKTGVATDIDGKFSIDVPNLKKGALVFTYVGMADKTVELKGRNAISVTLEPSSVALEEVVAIGYATVKRKDLTGSVSSVKGEDMLKTPGGDATQALAGRVSGVQIVMSDGQPGATPSVRVRGGISITQSNEPLYVIDGMPSEDGMSNLNPGDIETIDVLKDASATAIYGSRGANGVVVITTKSGSNKNGKAAVNFDAYFGVRKLANKLDVLSSEEFALADYERTIGWASDAGAAVLGWQNRYGGFADIAENYANRPGIDWLDETMGRTTTTQSYRATVSGGVEGVDYYMSYGYFNDEGAMVNSGSYKHSIAGNIRTRISKRLTIGGRVNYDYVKTTGAGVAGNGTNEGGSNVDARFNKLVQILQYRPIIGFRGSDDDLLAGYDPILDENNDQLVNPVLAARSERDDRIQRTFSASVNLSFNLGKGWTFRNNTGMRHQTYDRELFFGSNSIMGKREGVHGSVSNSQYGTFSISNVISYDRRINKKNRITVQVGQEYIARTTKTLNASVINLPNDDFGLNDMGLGTPSAITSSYNDDDKLLSFFARANYDFSSRYLISATFRADGSSKFGKNTKWGYFPAVSAAWRIKEEKWLTDVTWLSDLKLRAGYGLAGNNRIGSYNSLALMTSILAAMGGTVQPGYVANNIPNPKLKWEANKTFNVGVDFGMLNQRITVAPEFYINESNDLLLNAQVPLSSGYTTMLLNAGATRNVGIDLAINTVNISNRNFSWRTTLNLSHNKNTVVRLTGEDRQLYEGRFGFNQSTHLLEVGAPIGQFYGFETEGLYQVSDFNYNERTHTYTLKEGVPYQGNAATVRPGMWKFRDRDNNGIIDEDDKTVIGNAAPKLFGGLNNNFFYRNFDLSVFLTFSIGNDVLNATKLINAKSGVQNTNALAVSSSANRWMTVNAAGDIVTDPNELAALNAGKTVAAYYDMEQGDNYIHSWGVEDASYLKLSNITIGYTFPERRLKRLGVKRLRLYLTGNNLACLTKYTGFDPEVSTMRSGLTPGIDFGAYPLSRSFLFGLNITF